MPPDRYFVRVVRQAQRSKSSESHHAWPDGLLQHGVWPWHQVPRIALDATRTSIQTGRVCGPWATSTSSPGGVRNTTQRRIRRVQFMCASTAASSSAMKVSVSGGRLGMIRGPVSVSSDVIAFSEWSRMTVRSLPCQGSPVFWVFLCQTSLSGWRFWTSQAADGEGKSGFLMRPRLRGRLAHARVRPCDVYAYSSFCCFHSGCPFRGTRTLRCPSCIARWNGWPWPAWKQMRCMIAAMMQKRPQKPEKPASPVSPASPQASSFRFRGLRSCPGIRFPVSAFLIWRM